jgi:hypothetical protein
MTSPRITLHASESWQIPTDFRNFLVGVEQLAHRPKKSPREQFLELDVQPGDRVRLVEQELGRPKKDGAALEGVVKAVRTVEGREAVQIQGFDVQGNNIFWSARNYHIEVLHRAYRWTDRDRVIAEIADRADWATTRREDQREADRRTYGARADRILKLLGGRVTP